MNLYSENLSETPYQQSDGEIHLGTFNFEDWTDLYFDDLTMDVYLDPDTINSFPSPLSAVFSPGTISPGDTAEITLMKRKSDGTLSPFDESQHFDVQIIKGGENGTIYSTDIGDTSHYFQQIKAGIRFIAADSIKGDSAKVLMRISADTSGIIITKAIPNSSVKSNHEVNLPRLITNKNIPANILLRINRKIQSKSIVNSKVKQIASVLSSSITITGFAEVEVKRPQLILITPTMNTVNTIDETPQMPSILCKAQLKNYNKGGVTFDWKFKIEYQLNRVDWPNLNPICPRLGTCIFSGTSSTEDDQITTWSVPFTKSAGKFMFKGKAYYLNGGCDAITAEWAEGDNVFTGGEVAVNIIVKDNIGNIIDSATYNGGKILGTNPDPDMVESYAAPNEFKAIVIHESKKIQFNPNDMNKTYTNKKTHVKKTLTGSIYNRKGYPVYGPPDGFGLSQLDDPAATEMQLWNWKSNLDGGKNLFYSYMQIAKKFIAKHPDYNGKNPNSYELLLECTYQRYNSGYFYYKWDDLHKQWVKNPNITNNYGKIVYDIYLNLIN